ncbi:MAG: ribosomal L7Ae/L30e/S12e/Gadd45 family protein [Ruminococcus sp.]|nr:ribosomal L7Ae/L30e/S12e/Gadd45 family protein [Ruminococcus sp.]
MSLKKQKTADLLTICMKAGKIAKGFDSAKEAVINNEAYCILATADASPKTVKEIRFFSERNNVPVIITELEKSDIGRLSGKETAVIAVCDKGFAEGFSKIK